MGREREGQVRTGRQRSGVGCFLSSSMGRRRAGRGGGPGGRRTGGRQRRRARAATEDDDAFADNPLDFFFLLLLSPFLFCFKTRSVLGNCLGYLNILQKSEKIHVASHIHVEATQKLAFENKMF